MKIRTRNAAATTPNAKVNPYGYPFRTLQIISSHSPPYGSRVFMTCQPAFRLLLSR
jgi:hypothetical protein